MAKSKYDVKSATSRARLSEDEAVIAAYKHGTPLEAGKIADSETIDVFSSAHNVSKAEQGSDFPHSDQSSEVQQRKDPYDNTKEAEREASSAVDFSTGDPRLPKMGAPSAGYEY